MDIKRQKDYEKKFENMSTDELRDIISVIYSLRDSKIFSDCIPAEDIVPNYNKGDVLDCFDGFDIALHYDVTDIVPRFEDYEVLDCFEDYDLLEYLDNGTIIEYVEGLGYTCVENSELPNEPTSANYVMEAYKLEHPNVKWIDKEDIKKTMIDIIDYDI